MRAGNTRVGLVALAAVALLLSPAVLEAEVASSVTITGYTSVLRSGNSAELLAVLKSSLDLNSVGNNNVKGYFAYGCVDESNFKSEDFKLSGTIKEVKQ